MYIVGYYVFAQQVLQIRQLAAKVLFALSVNNFNAVFSRISGRLAELSVTNGEESQDYTDIELIQYINIDILKLIKLLNEAIAKFRYRTGGHFAQALSSQCLQISEI